MNYKEKAKRYDEALKAAIVASKDEDRRLKATLERIFPELKEGEDERTWIINYLSNRILNSTIIAEKENLKKAIAWLEKQGKNNMGISEATKQELENNLHKALEKETPESWNEFLDEQKPAEWSEEDEDIIEWLIGYLEYQIMNATIIEEKNNCLNAISMLKSLKERCTWKPSEEQMEALLKTIMAMPHRNYSQGERNAIENLYTQLKALV